MEKTNKLANGIGKNIISSFIKGFSFIVKTFGKWLVVPAVCTLYSNNKKINN